MKSPVTKYKGCIGERGTRRRGVRRLGMPKEPSGAVSIESSMRFEALHEHEYISVVSSP